MLKNDHENFAKYLSLNKAQKVEIEQRADAVLKEKKLIENEIKSMNIKLTSLRSEKSYCEDLVHMYKEHKAFIDRLASTEWEEQKRSLLAQRAELVKKAWVEEHLERQREGIHVCLLSKTPRA